MVRMGHDSPAAGLVYQHANRASDVAIAAALDVQLSDRKQSDRSTSQDGSGAHLGPEAINTGEAKSPKAVTRCFVWSG